jgi:hypothetical protein
MMPPLPACNKTLLDQRDQYAIAHYADIRHTLGINVTQDAQDIFDFIHKTYVSQ